MKLNKITSFVVISVLIQTTLFAQAVPVLYEMLPPVVESPAYKQMKRRPPSELSKMLYLVDRLKSLNVEVQYNSKRLPLKDVVLLVQAYIFTNFDRKGTAEKWILENASYSRSKRRPIWVHFPDGSSYLAKDVLLEELKRLEKVS